MQMASRLLALVAALGLAAQPVLAGPPAPGPQPPAPVIGMTPGSAAPGDKAVYQGGDVGANTVTGVPGQTGAQTLNTLLPLFPQKANNGSDYDPAGLRATLGLGYVTGAQVYIPVATGGSGGPVGLLLSSSGSTQQTDLMRVTSVSPTTVYARFNALGHLGIAASPTNAFMYIGSGTGTLTDNSAGSGATATYMGLKVKVDSSTAGGIDALQSNLNCVAGSAGANNCRAGVFRVDNNDTTGTGPAVALWADMFNAVATKRPTWGMNIQNGYQVNGVYTPNQYTTASPALGGEIGVSIFTRSSVDTSTLTCAGTLTAQSAQVTNVSCRGGYNDTSSVTAPGIPASTTVLSGSGTATIQLSNPATAGGTVTLTISPQANHGSILNFTAAGTNPLRSGFRFGSGPASGQNGQNSFNNVQNFMLLCDDDSSGCSGPSHYAYWYGPLAATSLPTGTPRTAIDRYGWIGLGMTPLSAPNYAAAAGNIPAQNGGLAVAGPSFFGSPATYKKQATMPAAPGAGNVVWFVVAGTNTGTCKIQALAGTSTTPFTLGDNIGSGC